MEFSGLAWLNILPARSGLAKWETLLKKEACRSTEAHWYQCEKRFYTILVRVAKGLYRKFAGSDQVTDDFVVYIDDEEGDMELIERTVPAKLFKKHFAQFKQPTIDTKEVSPKDLLKKYIDEIYLYRDQILAFGEAAIEPLIKKLDDPEGGWAAAGVLADLNLPRKAVINALRKQTSTYSATAEHCSRALLLLGDVEFLFSLVENAKTRPHAVVGIVTGLKVSASERKPPLALDYRHVERLLALKSPVIKRQLDKEIVPGSSLIEIVESDVDELLRGLESPHTVIRQHAVSVAGDRSLGKAAGKRLLPIIAESLNDPVANIRRLALLSLSYWKAAANPYHAQMKALQRDEDASVRQYARDVFRKD